MMSTSKALKQANKAATEEIGEVAQLGVGRRMTLGNTEFRTRVARPSSLTASDRADIWTMYEINMRSLVESSSLGWDPAEKRKELFHRDARFILIYNQKDEDEDTQETLVAYTAFRFEPGYEDEASVYCYEVQVCEGFRGLGLARFLVDKLAIIGKHWHMEKILLTVLKANAAARKVYDKLGFQMDPSSPDYPDSVDEEGDGDDEKEEVDYEILSKEL